MPQTRPVDPFHGIMSPDGAANSPAWPRSSSPRRLMPEIIKKFGTHPLADQYRVALRPETDEEYRLLRNDLLHGTRTKADLSRWIFDKGPFDFFLTVFADLDWSNHLLWDSLDPAHPRHDGARAPWCKELFRELFGRIDRTIGEMKQSHPEADLLVFSLSGMGPNYSGWHILPEVLARIGMSPGVERKGARVFPAHAAMGIVEKLASWNVWYPWASSRPPSRSFPRDGGIDGPVGFCMRAPAGRTAGHSACRTTTQAPSVLT